MKKVLSFLLAIVLVFSMTGCVGNDKKNEEAVRGVVDSFFEAYIDFDFDEVKEYVTDEDEIPEELREEYSIDKIMSEIPAELEVYSEQLEDILNNFMDKAKNEFAYEIKEVEKKEKDEYSVNVSFTVPTNLDDIEVEDVIGDKFNEEAVTAILLKMVEEGKINEASSEQDMIELLMPEMFKILEDAFDSVEFETASKEKEIIVVKSEDDEWLIDIEKSDFND